MAGKQYTSAPLLYNTAGEPIPQWLDTHDKTDSPEGTFKPLTKAQANNGIVQYYHEGDTDYIETFDIPMSGISIANDGLENLTFTVNGLTRTIYAGEVYNATLPYFTKLEITAKDKFRVEVLQ